MAGGWISRARSSLVIWLLVWYVCFGVEVKCNVQVVGLLLHCMTFSKKLKKIFYSAGRIVIEYATTVVSVKTNVVFVVFVVIIRYKSLVKGKGKTKEN